MERNLFSFLKNIKNTPKVFSFSSDIPLPSDFPYQAARPAWEKSRPPHTEKGPVSPFPLYP
jgi:hypothetical protein